MSKEQDSTQRHYLISNDATTHSQQIIWLLYSAEVNTDVMQHFI